MNVANGIAHWGCEKKVCKEKHRDGEGCQFVTSQECRRVGILNHMVFQVQFCICYTKSNKNVSKFMHKFMAYLRYFCSD
jgi:hypothetical protein